MNWFDMLSALTPALLIFTLMFALSALKIPLFASMFISGSLGYIALSGATPWLSAISTQIYARLINADFAVIALFIFMGYLANASGISQTLFNFLQRLLGRFPAGLALASVSSSAAFGAICGSATATAASISTVAIPPMIGQGYDKHQVTGVLAASGTLGILIPPSVPLLIYAILTEQSVTKLFAASIVPAILAFVGYGLVCTVVFRQPKTIPLHEGSLSQTQNEQKTSIPTKTATFSRFIQLIPSLSFIFIFLLTLLGIYLGWFSAPEAASIGIAGMLFTFMISVFIQIPHPSFIQSIRNFAKIFSNSAHETALSCAMIFALFIGADIMNAALALSQLPQHLLTLFNPQTMSPLVFVGGIILLYIVLGGVMDELSMLLLTLPIFFPILMQLPWDQVALFPNVTTVSRQEAVAIWFGILTLMSVGFGLLAPPLGLNVYLVHQLMQRWLKDQHNPTTSSTLSLIKSYKGVLPYLITDFIRIILLFFIPYLSLVFL